MYRVLGCVRPFALRRGGWDYSRGWPEKWRTLWSPRLTLGEQCGHRDAKQRAGTCESLGGGEYAPMYAAYLPQRGRCAQNEPIEKRLVKVEHMSHSNILAMGLVGV